MSSSYDCQHNFGAHEDSVVWKSRWCRECYLCGRRNTFSKKMAKCKTCRQVFAHKRCLMQRSAEIATNSQTDVPSVVAANRDAAVHSNVDRSRDAEVPSVTASPGREVKAPAVVGCNRVIGVPGLLPDAVPQPPVDPEATFTVDIVLSSRVVVVAHPSWMTWHRIVVPAACRGVFSLRPGVVATETTAMRSLEARVEILTTVEVTDSRRDCDRDGRPVDVNVVQRVRFRSTATTVVFDSIDGSLVNDLIYHVKCSARPRVEIVDVPAAAG